MADPDAAGPDAAGSGRAGKVGAMARIASFHLLREPAWRAPQVMVRMATDRARLTRVPGPQPDVPTGRRISVAELS